MESERIRLEPFNAADDQFRAQAQVGDLLTELQPGGTPRFYLVVEKGWERRIEPGTGKVVYFVNITVNPVPADIVQGDGPSWVLYRRSVLAANGWL